MINNNSIVYLYGFSTMLESKMINFNKIIKRQVNEDVLISTVFIHDGVIGTSQKSKISPHMKELLDLPINFYVLTPDLKARGINVSNIYNRIKSIEYEDLVDMLAITSKIVSWM